MEQASGHSAVFLEASPEHPANHIEAGYKPMLGGLREILARLFRRKSKVIAADPRSEFARIREDRHAALTAFKAAIDCRDTRLQRSTQLKAIQATNAALRGGR